MDPHSLNKASTLTLLLPLLSVFGPRALFGLNCVSKSFEGFSVPVWLEILCGIQTGCLPSPVCRFVKMFFLLFGFELIQWR